MTVYLYCEGVTDYAVIPSLMKKSGNNYDMDIHWIKKSDLKKMRTHRKSGIVISGHYKMIKALAAAAEKDNIQFIAYHQDADRNYTNVYKAIKSEFEKLSRFHCLAIVPKEMIESWLLADENAYPSVPNNPQLPSKPEERWGQKDDPDSNHPYNYFVRVLSQFGLSDDRATYARIAEKSDINVLKRRCPESFGQFYVDMQKFIAGTEDAPCPKNSLK
jgi:hypothetical protein